MSLKSELHGAGLLTKIGAQQIEIIHSPGCLLFKGKPCNCRPQIRRVDTDGPT